MELPENFQEKSLKIGIAALTLVIGIAAGYSLSTAVAPGEEKSSNSYCQNVETGLTQQYNESTVKCHKPGWVTLSPIANEIENKTNVRCVCTRVLDGQLEIFPIRAATE